ncbi:hypothetical protein A2627_02520 [Candidatus Woesebacteria bacterium RIFCSPHIGHO2_01_FULL_39_28]|uniref:Methyltransferase type 11 domain-containing protein n=1 Tax=Candidatus Woesebacteria bacterium RIFCSPHIGHO2_01_FULL_39_28 TaxID=1802496 RepID=A0A1F7YJG3_9BACT|nr:MAG: hypothetical protein A2627_02520 [Candidatus Woesebacteria bacterium RIFCSPHIGHO2_01_FULL_39_28]OGM57202.1 MAG: hypothetical protein A3A50_03380 [Candidatus Woesebacteria bacterium RIFCSPLOWO2_01_FULL_38_20]
MEISEYKNIFENEETHFFYRANHNIILSLVKKYLSHETDLKAKSKQPIAILDAGCGTGLLARKLAKFGKVYAIDISCQAVKYSRQRKVNAIKASITKIPFSSNFFDLVISNDVIYHKKVANDITALSEMYRVLKDKGILILRVPAIKWLATNHDKFVHTRERYSKNSLLEKLTKSGFQVEKLFYTNLLLVPVALVLHLGNVMTFSPPLEGGVSLLKENDISGSIHPRTKVRGFLETAINKSQPKSGVVPTSKILNEIFYLLLLFESRLSKVIDFPLGLGLMAVCRKPSKRSGLP